MYDLISLTTRRQIFALLAIFLSCLMTAVHAEQELISVFPLDNYNQTVDRWIKPDDADYDKPLISSEVQQQRMNEFYQHYFGESSPWNADYVNHVVKQAAPDDLQTLEKILIGNYSNKNKSGNEIGYGENFRPHTQGWIHAIAANINLSQFDNSTYHANQRGIAIDNLHVRVLPSEDVHFYHHKLAGQGYPFDNLQMSSLWAGTPVYIIGESRDRAWSFVLTPDFIGWVKSKGIVRTSDAFVRQWQAAAKAKLAAITQTQVSLIDNKNQYLLTVYVGSVFPATGDENNIKLMIPAAGFDHQAVIKDASVKAGQAAIMPLAATPHHFANLMRTMIGRPYGWGGMYFYNDCSAELKSLFTPFGIWLPRHSSDQVMRGRMVDVSSYSQSERLAYLKRNGRKLLTIVYIGGHVFLDVGNQKQGDNETVMTYQNMWGLSPSPSTRRAVVGQSVLFPLLLQYPEDPTLMSHANKKYFQVAFLDQMPSSSGNKSLRIYRMILRTLMFPDFTGILENLPL